MIEIDKGVAIPVNKKSKLYNSRYPWESMEIGDSFLVPNEGKNKGNISSALKTFRTVTSRANKRYGKRFTVKIDHEGKLRCWRVE